MKKVLAVTLGLSLIISASLAQAQTLQTTPPSVSVNQGGAGATGLIAPLAGLLVLVAILTAGSSTTTTTTER